MTKMIKKIAFFSLVLLIGACSLSKDVKRTYQGIIVGKGDHYRSYNIPYDELKDSEGNIKEHYKEVYEYWTGLNGDEKREANQKYKRKMDNVFDVMAFPRILTSKENNFLKKALSQRARAIKYFLVDIFSGSNNIIKQKVIHPGVVDNFLKRMLFSESKIFFQYREWVKRNIHKIHFLMGSDLIRDSDGEFRVLEDNVGPRTGGIDFAYYLNKNFYSVIKEFGDLKSDSYDPIIFYKELFDEYRNIIKISKSFGDIAYTYSDKGDIYQGSQRMKDLSPHFNIKVFNVDKDIISHNYVGFHMLSENFASLKGTVVFDHILKGNMPASYFLGAIVAGDKELTFYIDHFIKFYLKETPLFKMIPGGSFRYYGNKDDKKLNKVFYQHVFSNLQNFVIKKVDGTSGKGVWVGKYLKVPMISHLKKLIKKNPDFFIAQQYIAPSRIFNNSVDLRILVEVTPNKVIYSNSGFSRIQPIDKGDGKVNVAQGGKVMPLVILK